jgi:hypothetical protein
MPTPLATRPGIRDRIGEGIAAVITQPARRPSSLAAKPGFAVTSPLGRLLSVFAGTLALIGLGAPGPRAVIRTYWTHPELTVERGDGGMTSARRMETATATR